MTQCQEEILPWVRHHLLYVIYIVLSKYKRKWTSFHSLPVESKRIGRRWAYKEWNTEDSKEEQIMWW